MGFELLTVDVVLVKKGEGGPRVSFPRMFKTKSACYNV